MLQGFFLAFLAFCTVAVSSQAIYISEIMYNPLGADSGNEWVEVYNNDTDTYNISLWKINTGNTDHGFNEPPENGGQGSVAIASSEYFIVAQNAANFISNHAGYTGTVIDSSWTDLKNSGNETLWIRNSTDVFDNITTIFVDEGNTTCVINNSLRQCEETPGGENKEYSEKTNKTEPETPIMSCDISVDIITSNVVYNISKMDFDIRLNDTDCQGQAHNSTVSYYVEDMFSNVVKPIENKTVEFVCTSTTGRQWTPDDVVGSEAYYIKAVLADAGCNDTFTGNDAASKTIIITGNNSHNTVSNIFIENTPSAVKYGGVFIADVVIYRGDTGKYAVDVWVESDGKKISETTTVHADRKFTTYALGIPIKMKENCDNQLKTGTYSINASGLGIAAHAEINITGTDTSNCKTVTVQTGGGSSGSGGSSFYPSQPAAGGNTSSASNQQAFYEIISFNSSAAAGSNITTRVSILNNFTTSKNFTVYSYVFIGNNPVSAGTDENGKFSKTYNANQRHVVLRSKSSQAIDMVNLIEPETEGGTYNLRVRFKLDGIERDITKNIEITEAYTESSLPDIIEDRSEIKPSNVSTVSRKYGTGFVQTTGLVTAEDSRQSVSSYIAIISPIEIFFRLIHDIIGQRQA